MDLIGVDIGGTGIKAAPVDQETGEVTADRYRLLTPKGAHPKDVLDVVQQVVEHFGDTTGPIGITFPGVVLKGVVHTAANMGKEWIGCDADAMFTERLGRPVTMLNDADAAGIAEMAFGAGRGRTGVVLVVTLGTGIGTALFANGTLVPNTELGHLELDGKDAEKIASGTARDSRDMSSKQYAKHLDKYLSYLDRLFWPELLVLGGGVSKQGEKYLPHLTVRAEVALAQLRNNAGIVGAAMNVR